MLIFNVPTGFIIARYKTYHLLYPHLTL